MASLVERTLRSLMKRTLGGCKEILNFLKKTKSDIEPNDFKIKIILVFFF